MTIGIKSRTLIDFHLATIHPRLNSRSYVPAVLSQAPPTINNTGLVGYTANHICHAHHRRKIIAATTERQHHVTLRVAIHRLKEEGKSGTVLVGNLARDLTLPVALTCSEVQRTAIENLWMEWIDWTSNYNLALELLEMYRLPKFLLYSPCQPQLNSNHLILHEVFYQAGDKDPIPKFASNCQVTILLVITYMQYKNILIWKERLKNTGDDDATMSDGDGSDISVAEKVFCAATQPKKGIRKSCTPEQLIVSTSSSLKHTKTITSSNAGHSTISSRHQLPNLVNKVPEGVAEPGANNFDLEDNKMEEDELDKDKKDEEFQARDKEELEPVMGAQSKEVTFKDELAKMLIEANCMYWGTNLMKIVYQFIASCPVRNKDPSELPPPEIHHRKYAACFGEGNWTDTLYNFPQPHCCNVFCAYFALDPVLTTQDRSNSSQSSSLKIFVPPQGQTDVDDIASTRR
ncbi:hypothetical protein SERLA73DRAFT_68611 [Serpula lacrymans var. lacrymans S7.3]|uniref:Alpha-type protein kinase domain-containing protein n=2 Tax=Serpula lacrymans var. lacrymans TaxID=341189 RepID=F8PHB1_SERL3|nr:uncharacterized protein SERLADRAFT_432377 [Serpula lacrymans var. lacrymans S7.9]EGO04957.1 hypothetical protein SERLA73DRAFT_68611 [Serpula lacrymans var. lacrymans S7.3]EGO30755.1 hypothetical protein SERLADRAFT_432377 [Serpula lacrymans var. lacrymans S7.9]